RFGAGSFGILWNRVPGPLEFPGEGVEATHLATRLVCCIVIRDTGTYHNGVSNHGGRGRFFALGESFMRNAKAIAEGDDAVIAKIFARLAIGCVDRDKACIDRGNQNSKLAVRRFPGRDSAIGEISVSFIAVNLGVVRPTLSACDRIERNDPAERSTQVE